MAAAVRASQFLNRISEREHLDALLADARAGHSAALVLRGEAGVGKTALLRYAEQQAVGFRAAQTAGAEAEMELPLEIRSRHELSSALPSSESELAPA